MWDEIQAVATWVAIAAAVIMGAVVERMRRVFATREELDAERKARKTADGHQDDRIVDMAQTLHNSMGRFDLLRDEMYKQDRAREREVAKLREEVRTGFARILEKLERNNQRGG